MLSLSRKSGAGRAAAGSLAGAAAGGGATRCTGGGSRRIARAIAAASASLIGSPTAPSRSRHASRREGHTLRGVLNRLDEVIFG